MLARSGGGAKLPSVGLCLNASKAEARLDMATLLLGLLFVRGRIGFYKTYELTKKVSKSPVYKALFFQWISLKNSGFGRIFEHLFSVD